MEITKANLDLNSDLRVSYTEAFEVMHNYQNHSEFLSYI